MKKSSLNIARFFSSSGWVFSEVRIFYMMNCFFIIVLFVVLAACSSSKPPLFIPPPEFDSSTYINPKDFGYDSEMSIVDGLAGKKLDELKLFSPISFEGGLVAIHDAINYPRSALVNQIQGEVVLDVYVDTTNTIAYVDVIDSPSMSLSRAAVEAVTSVEHTPATYKGEIINSFIRIPLTFKLYEVKVRREINRRFQR